ncbi:E2 SUMO-conjugating protein ubc9 [Boothiomyces macroporosus]|uniref:E2 SUMO-conjugating protein ubc9 n=1 Tax=Boothiomyces macroporosus TaxID=261099 RepID=A0AAD5YAQ7_9FUNG|nr:E2 SUMO-conjugating protein ubc9 [Boothiomyces macroporosus]KAJ3308786.1 E2 SUMO-conjugating protein ubc9 [Boothiomyces sp. JEL0838]
MSTNSILNQRLAQERKQWRKDHPFGFVAKPKTINNAVDLTIWDCTIPGREGGLWEVCLSIINESLSWKPSISVKEILLGIQDLLEDPNPDSPANGPANKLFTKDRRAYEKNVKLQVQKFTELN